ncbi:MAG: hypothetical protein FWC47_10445 [Oscillospiraceae bacterium]|nr:hypothetical protein [Oscillospiraceae bacterium]
MEKKTKKTDLDTIQKSSKKYADTAFRTLFNNEKKAIELCNAIVGTNYPENAALKICTLSSDSLLSHYNDLAFCVENQLLVMSEHKSTLNINI